MTTYNTGNPLGSTDPRDLYDNAENLDSFSNGSSTTYLDRLGVSRRSMSGIDASADAVLGGIGYAPPTAYTSGISLTLTTQTVEYLGEVYAPKISSLPFTTSGTFEVAKFRLIQGVSFADLSSLNVKVSAPRFEGTAPNDSGTPDAIFRVSRSHTRATAPHAFSDQTVFAPPSAGIAACSFDAALASSGSQNMDHTIGFQSRNAHSGSGTLTNMYGFGSYPIVNSGTVTNCIGLDVAPHTGVGTVTNEYGVYIRNQNSTATNKYPIYIPSSFGKNVIGAATNFNNSGVVSIGGTVKLFLGDSTNGYKSIAYNHNQNTNTYDYADQIQSMYFGPQDITFRSAVVGVAGATPSFVNILNIRTDSTNHSYRAFFPGVDNVSNLGVGGLRWKEIFCANGVINTSDARVKTEVRALTDPELAAAKQLSKEIGAFKFLESIEKKGEAARIHIGMTVQRVIEIMKSHGLDAMKYGFICYDEWESEYEDHPAIYEQVIVEPEQIEITPAVMIEIKETVMIDGVLKEVARQIEIPEQQRIVKDAMIGDGPVRQEAWRETKREAGNTYGFRTDQLLMFIARGFEFRLSALENV